MCPSKYRNKCQGTGQPGSSDVPGGGTPPPTNNTAASHAFKFIHPTLGVALLNLLQSFVLISALLQVIGVQHIVFRLSIINPFHCQIFFQLLKEETDACTYTTHRILCCINDAPQILSIMPIRLEAIAISLT